MKQSEDHRRMTRYRRESRIESPRRFLPLVRENSRVRETSRLLRAVLASNSFANGAAVWIKFLLEKLGTHILYFLTKHTDASSEIPRNRNIRRAILTFPQESRATVQFREFPEFRVFD